MRPALVILGALLVACAPEPEGIPCGLRLSPDEATRALTESAAKRWTKATGCPVTVEAGGVPVLAVSPITRKGCEGACGCVPTFTITRAKVVEIDLEREGCADPATVVAHEMAHALAPRSDPSHTSGGLMAEAVGNGARIDEAALELVCSDHDCQAFRPEVPR